MKNTILESIYENARMDFPMTKIVEASITEEIENILKQQKSALPMEEREALRNMLFEVSNISEKKGFILGFRYAISLLSES